MLDHSDLLVLPHRAVHADRANDIEDAWLGKVHDGEARAARLGDRQRRCLLGLPAVRRQCQCCTPSRASLQLRLEVHHPSLHAHAKQAKQERQHMHAKRGSSHSGRAGALSAARKYHDAGRPVLY